MLAVISLSRMMVASCWHGLIVVQLRAMSGSTVYDEFRCKIFAAERLTQEALALTLVTNSSNNGSVRVHSSNECG